MYPPFARRYAYAALSLKQCAVPGEQIELGKSVPVDKRRIPDAIKYGRGEDQPETMCDEADVLRKAPLRPARGWGAAMSHVGGWGAFVGVWAVLIGAFSYAVEGNPNTPDSIYSIIVVEAFLFFLFGLNQFLGTVFFDVGKSGWNYYFTESGYVVLSATAKLFLGIMAFQGTLMTYSRNLSGSAC